MRGLAIATTVYVWLNQGLNLWQKWNRATFTNTVLGRIEEIEAAEVNCSPENADTEESYMER